MPIFQKSVLKKYVNHLNSISFKTSWENFQLYFHNPEIQENIRNSKEEQYQEGFLEDLFVKVLGYVKNPSPHFNLTTELKNIGNAKKTDGAILNKKGEALAVIELKGTDTTNLGKVEEQAFGYKNHQKNCPYVIISNFEKLRFYIDNATEFEEFNLFQLKKEKFQILFLCLASDNLLRNLPKKMKEDSLIQEESITLKLYKDYSNFRNEVFENMQVKNPKMDKLLLFNKAQKLLDRFIFIFFAEDRGLLEPNLIKKIIIEWDTLKKDFNLYFPLYARFKEYFNHLNQGFKNDKHNIFAYNGGLFAPDSILDSIEIDDLILRKHTFHLSNYDFADEVSVNILGHIFEHSLTEIEEIQKDLSGFKNLTGLKNQSKRKKDGVFYTPRYITKYIVDNTIGKLCEERKNELGIFEEDYEKERKGRKKQVIKALQEKLKNYRNWLLDLTICDPACGSGAFLNQALEFLMAEHRYIDELESKLLNKSLILSEIENVVLEKNLYGVDVNYESVEIAKLSLWLSTAKVGRKLSMLNDNIKVGNSLIDDKKIAGEKAFDWKKEFPQIFKKEGFDVVIGNPPYGVNFTPKLKKYLSNFDDLVPDYEIYIYFISLYKRILKSEGILSYIFPNTFLSTLFGKKYRDRLFQEVSVYQMTDLSEDRTFKDASVRTCIMAFENTQKDYRTILGKMKETEEYKIVNILSKDEILKKTKNMLILFSAKKHSESILKKIKQFPVLESFYTVSQGLIPYDKYRGQNEETIKNRIWHADYQKDKSYKKELKGGDINRYNIQWNGNLWISYGDWLAAPRDKKFFTSPRILVREITNGFLFCGYTEEEYYNTPSAINIIDEKQILNLKYSLVLLNSKLLGWYHNNTSPKAKKGLFPKILVNDIRNIPLVPLSQELQKPLIEKSNKMLELNSALQKINQNFLKVLKNTLSLNKVSKKIQNWHNLEENTFLSELDKAKLKLGLTQKGEWLQYFTQEKNKAYDLQLKIQEIDQAIDSMVYKLYDLTEEEIRIVENGES